MKNFKLTVVVIAIISIVLLLLQFCENFLIASEKAEVLAAKAAAANESLSQAEIVFDDSDEDASGSANLEDNDKLYEDSDPFSITTMYLTVSEGNSSENTDHTWSEINKFSAFDYDEMGTDKYSIEGLLQVGDSKGPSKGELGYGSSAPNATVTIRGQYSTLNPQKSYKIKLKDNQGSWNGQTTIALNKHMGEGLRFRNKLMFDMMADIDGIMSLRTQFVHLYVKDNSAGGTGKFVDYGLYTQVEQLNKSALKAHGLSDDGQLYKVNNFEFYRYEDIIKTTDDDSYDQDAFEQLLEIKGSTDHTKLIDMLDDVNDVSVPVEDIIDKHFNMQNLTYWMAFMILTDNVDTQNRNMYLYSPLNSDTWYIIPWDNDEVFFDYEHEILGEDTYGSWESGVSNFWGNVLFQRCLKSETFRASLDDAMTDIYENYFNEENFSSLLKQYAAVVEPYCFTGVDGKHEPITKEQYNEEIKGLPAEVTRNYKKYQQSLQNPLPFYIGDPYFENEGDDSWILSWDAAYDFQNQDISYKTVVATDPTMKNVVADYEGDMPEMSLNVLDPGQYYIKVLAIDTDGNQQIGFDSYSDDTKTYYGVKAFVVGDDGSVSGL